MNKLLSICVPTYNRLEKIKSQIQFLIKEGVETNKDVEVIVSDNASPDETYDRYLSGLSYENIRIFEQVENIGLIGNLHFLLSKSQGLYSWIIGDDDILRPGIVEHVLSVLKEHSDIEYVFINHCYVIGENIIKQSVFSGKSGYHRSGFDTFEELVKESGFGTGMFLTANIFRTSSIMKTNKVLNDNNEINNMALPLAYSIYCANGPAYFIGDPMICDQFEDTSWSDKSVLVHCRDMIAVIDIISCYIGKDASLRDILIHNLPASYPVIKYEKVKKNFTQNNYALDFYKKYYPDLLVRDRILGPLFMPFEKVANKLRRLLLKTKNRIKPNKINKETWYK